MRSTLTARIAKAVGIGAVGLTLALGSGGSAMAGTTANRFELGDTGGATVDRQVRTLMQRDRGPVPVPMMRGRIGFLAE